MTTTTTTMNPTDTGSVIASDRIDLDAFSWALVRVSAGLILVPHGAQKLFGWFGGGGLTGTAQFFEQNLNLYPGLLFAGLAGLTEFFSGLFLALGLLTRLSAAAVVAVMGYAAFIVHWGNGFFWTSGGYEFPLLWGLVALALVIRGGGALSVDKVIGWKY